MRTKVGAAAFVLIGVGATSVGALNAVNMLGSDTMNLLTKDVIANCPTPPGLPINYVGTGSGNGETNMKGTFLGTPAATGPQTAASMSRFLKAGTAAAPLSCAVNGGKTAAGLAVALDGVSIVANAANAPASCGGTAQTGKVLNLTGGGTYVAADAFDFIRVAWFGIHHDKTGTCGDSVRTTLLSQYGNIFDSATCPNPGTCATGIRHLWRRDDPSGTTDTFTTLVGGGAAVGTFCNVNGGLTTTNGQVLGAVAKNGNDFQDNDPIRTPCTGNGFTGGEQVCGDAGQGHMGTLGVVLTVYLPDTRDVPATSTYAKLCRNGAANILTQATKPAYSGLCPGGGLSVGGKCFHPVVQDPVTLLDTPNCLVANTATGTGGGTRCPLTLLPAGGSITDCRGANLWIRDAAGNLAVDDTVPAQVAATPNPSLGNGPAGKFYLGAFYRLHTTTKQPNAVGTGLCTSPSSSTEQIGCLASEADPCTLGFAGRSAADGANATALNVGGVLNDVAHIQNLITIGPYNPPTNTATYPLARKLFYSSMVGFGANPAFAGSGITGDELALAKCYVDPTVVDSTGAGGIKAHIITSNGFVLMPAGALCVDFHEENPLVDATHPDPDKAGCASGVAAVDSCTFNPAGIPTAE